MIEPPCSFAYSCTLHQRQANAAFYVRAATCVPNPENRTQCAMHCAELLCYLCGRTESAFDFAWRPFFLKFGVQESGDTRSNAFLELCSITGLVDRDPGEFLA